VAVLYCLIIPRWLGSIELASPDPRSYPTIYPNYLSTELSRTAVVDSFKLRRHLTAAPSLQPYIVREVLPGIDIQADARILDSARNIAQILSNDCCYHQAAALTWISSMVIAAASSRHRYATSSPISLGCTNRCWGD